MALWNQVRQLFLYYRPLTHEFIDNDILCSFYITYGSENFEHRKLIYVLKGKLSASWKTRGIIYKILL